MTDGWSDPLRALADLITELMRREPALRAAVRGIAEALLTELTRLESPESSAAPPSPAASFAPSPGSAASPPISSALNASTPAEVSAALDPLHAPVVTPLAPMAPATPAQAMRQLRIGDAVIDVSARLSPEESAVARWAPTLVNGAGSPAPVEDVPVAERAADLSLLARRARLKRDACRWAAQRRQRLASGADRDGVADRDRAFFSDAKAIPNCYLWMMDPGGPLLPGDDATLEELAGCYDALAAVADLLVQVDQQEDRHATDFERDAFDLAASAQSALRVALERVEALLVDVDQNELFWWLRGEASENRRAIHIFRHMRRDDGADPAACMTLLERIEALRGQLDARRQQHGERRRLLGKVRYHADRISRSGGGNGDANVAGNAGDEDWAVISAAVESLVSTGLPPSDRELRERLLPVIDQLPEREFDAGMTAVLTEVDRYLEQVERDPQQPAARASSPALQAARDMLRGKVAVLLGGYPREQYRRTIETAFELAELRWLRVGHGQSLEAEMLPQFRRAETRVFIVMTRFRSHQFGPQVRAWCREYGKVVVELPGGYGVEQIAHQVVQQVQAESLCDA
ncbi:MAG: hypothetical protein ABIP55_16165 [Tepidisphaeraceae bacterium]